jgi:hypothetical protein
MTKSIILAGAIAAAALASATTANAHSAGDVEEILQDHGYSRIQFTDTNPSNYMVNACKGDTRYHFHVNNRGEVTERREIGSCGVVQYRANHDSDEDGDDDGYRQRRWHGWGHRWGGWRNRWGGGGYRYE